MLYGLPESALLEGVQMFADKLPIQRSRNGFLASWSACVEDMLRASGINTAEAAHEQTQDEDATVAGQVGDETSIMTMDAVGCCTAMGTSG
jgi:hypothetical protein